MNRHSEALIQNIDKLIALYLGGVDDAFLYHVDVLSLHGIVTHVGRPLQNLLYDK